MIFPLWIEWLVRRRPENRIGVIRFLVHANLTSRQQFQRRLVMHKIDRPLIVLATVTPVIDVPAIPTNEHIKHAGPTITDQPWRAVELAEHARSCTRVGRVFNLGTLWVGAGP